MDPETNRESNASRKRPRGETHRPEHVYPRKRAITACRLCRHRKVKCNNQRPICGACADSNASCVYEDTDDHSVFDPASLKILERLDQVLSKLDSMPVTAPVAPSSASVVNGLSNGHEILPHPTRPIPSGGQNDQASADDEAWMPAGRTNVESVLAWPVFSDCQNPNHVLDAIYGAESEDSEDGPHLKGQNQRSKAAGVVEEDIPRLVQRFVEFVHLKNPVVDVDTLWSYTHQIVEDGIDWSPSSCLVVCDSLKGLLLKS